MKKTPAKIKRPLWVVGLNLALALTVGSTQAFADTLITNQAELEAIGANEVTLGANYVVTESFEVVDPFAGGNTYVTGTFTGTFDGGGFTISGLTKPLFEVIGAALNITIDDVEIDTVEIKDLDLYAATGEGGGITGNGALANILEYDGTIDNVSFTGDISGGSGNYGMLPVGIGGLVGVSVGTISNSYAAGTVEGDSYVGGLVGYSYVGTISNSYATGDVTGNDNDVTGNDNVGGLVGVSVGTISNSYATGEVRGNDNVGGLVGTLLSTVFSESTIDNSYATGDVIGSGEYIGGLVGWLEAGAIISNSYAKTGTVTGGEDEGDHGIGGLVGYSSGYISGSYAEGNVNGFEQVGGLVGSTGIATQITDSYATGTVTGSGDDVGGLVGLLDLNHMITNSYAAGTVEGTNDVGGLVGYSEGTITNSYATGEVRGTGTNYDMNLADDYSDVGGLVGENGPGAFITDSFATGNVTGALVYTGRLVGYSDYYSEISGSFGYGEAERIDGTLIDFDLYPGEGEAPNILDIVNNGYDPEFEELPFKVDSRINLGRPYLTSLEESYDVVEEDTEETPSYSLRSFYTQAAKSLDKALISLGFKSNFSSHPNLGFKALEQNQSNSPAVIQLFEVSEYQNSNILLSKEDGLQLSISSYYKEAVEIWTQGLNGEYLYLGLIEFDKDGKAILPALKFDTASTYQLLMIKAADKVSEKPNLEAKVGQITINVF